MSIVYLFQFNPCVFESSFETKSIHKTKRGAYYAMRNYIEERFNEFIKVRDMYGKDKESDIELKCLIDQDWRIISMEVKG